MMVLKKISLISFCVLFMADPQIFSSLSFHQDIDLFKEEELEGDLFFVGSSPALTSHSFGFFSPSTESNLPQLEGSPLLDPKMTVTVSQGKSRFSLVFKAALPASVHLVKAGALVSATAFVAKKQRRESVNIANRGACKGAGSSFLADSFYAKTSRLSFIDRSNPYKKYYKRSFLTDSTEKKKN